MTYSTLPSDLRSFVEKELTKRQLDCLKLSLAGYGRRRIALALGISQATVREHLDCAHSKLRQHPAYPLVLERAA